MAGNKPLQNRAQVLASSATTGEAEHSQETGASARPHLTRARSLSIIGALGLAAVVIAALAIDFGTVRIDLWKAWTDPASADSAILMTARLPRVLMSMAIGGILASVGAALQALVRNPLAEGGILGISGGGAFGAIVALILGGAFGDTTLTVPLMAFGMALLSTVAVYRLGQVEGRLEPFSLLLVGVIFNAFWGSMILLANSLVNFYQTHSILAWLMGSIEAPSWTELTVVTAFGAAGFAVLMLNTRDMNLLSLGDDAAADLGVDVDRVRRSIFLATSVMIGAAVSVSGMIGFVGLIVPHVLRLLFGSDHRLLLPASLLGGAAFLVLADLVARIVIAPAEIPVGVVTALCGAPFFIAVLRRERRQSMPQ